MKQICIFKVATLAVALVISFGAYAQEAGDKAAGAHIVVGVGDEFTNIGIGAKFQYGITGNIRGEGSFTFFPKKDGLGMWDISINGHYLIGIPTVPSLKVYPIAGLGLMGYPVGGGDDYDGGDFEYDFSTRAYGYGYDEDDYDESDWGEGGSSTIFGLNLGGGAEYKLTDNISANLELKYRIGFDSGPLVNRLMISAGIAYKF
jgi:outer membrane protein X